MRLPPLPQFSDVYDARKLRTLSDILENAFNALAKTSAKADSVAVCNASATPQGNVGSTETILYTTNIEAAVLKIDGWQLIFKTFGIFNTNGNNKEIKVKLNGNVIYDSGSIAANGGAWVIEGMIVRTGLNSQSIIVETRSGNASFASTALYVDGSEDCDLAWTITISATGAADNDVIGKALVTTIQPL